MLLWRMYKGDVISITSMYEDVDLTVRSEPNELAEEGKICTAAREGSAEVNVLRLFGEGIRVIHRVAWRL